MSDAVVVFDNVWKKFRRGERHDSLRDLVPATFSRLRNQPHAELSKEEFWAVSDVSFEVQRGEALGIIGPNGAGKSTTLKLLTRILRPSRGHAKIRGRVGALIEVAAGFHPDLTGRENIFLQGAIMGMKREDIRRRLDEIVDFAGMRDFIETPVKRYSSGMNARLGFSIASHLEPDVLIIDEVLSVGDMSFQERCIDRMREFRRAGVTIVFVSHNLQAVAQLCDRAMYLDRVCKSLGPTDEVLQAYVATSRNQVAPTGSERIRISSVELLGRDAAGPIIIAPGEHLTLRVEYVCREALSDLTFGFHLLRSTDNLLVYDGNIGGPSIGLNATDPDERLVLDFHFKPHVTRGQYHVELHVFHNPTQNFLFKLSPALILTVRESKTYAGVADIELSATRVGTPDEGPITVA